MKKGVVSIDPAAIEEAELATEWYRQRSPRAAQRFLDEIDRLIQRVAEHPAQFPRYEAGTRRAFLRRFPYFIVFRELGSSYRLLPLRTNADDPDIGTSVYSNDEADGLVYIEGVGGAA